MTHVLFDRKKVECRLIDYAIMIRRVRTPSVGDIKDFPASPSVKKSALDSVRSGNVSEFEVVEKQAYIDVSCKVHANVIIYIDYPVSFSYSAQGIGTHRCECMESVNTDL